jgi:hypothetical protein
VVALVSAVVSGFQWLELQKAGVQTDKTIAALGRQAGATEGQLTVMQGQLEQQKIQTALIKVQLEPQSPTRISSPTS